MVDVPREPVPFFLPPERLFVPGPFFTLVERHNALISSVGGTTPVQLFRGDPNRWSWQVFNISNDVYYVSWHPTNQATDAIRLEPYGGNLLCSYTEDGSLVWREVWIHAAAGGGGVYSIELVMIP